MTQALDTMMMVDTELFRVRPPSKVKGGEMRFVALKVLNSTGAAHGSVQQTSASLRCDFVIRISDKLGKPATRLCVSH